MPSGLLVYATGDLVLHRMVLFRVQDFFMLSICHCLKQLRECHVCEGMAGWWLISCNAGHEFCCSNAVTGDENWGRSLLDACSTCGKCAVWWLLLWKPVRMPCRTKGIQRSLSEEASKVLKATQLACTDEVHIFNMDRQTASIYVVCIMQCLRNVGSIGRLATRLEEIEFDVSLVTTEWFLCLFAKSLPSEVHPYELGLALMTQSRTDWKGVQLPVSI